MNFHLSVSTEPESLVISSQVSRRGGTAFVEEVLEDNPVLITFSFEVVYNNIHGVEVVYNNIHVVEGYNKLHTCFNER